MVSIYNISFSIKIGGINLLVVLSEIDCLSFLQSNGVYPDEFYTDFEMFKNRSVLMSDATVVVLFAGCCHFNKRRVCEFITQLKAREVSETDTGISKVHIISDSFLPNIDNYYKYSYYPNYFDKCSKWKISERDIDVWGMLKSEKRECKLFIDREKSTRAKVTDAELHDDELIKLIKVPVLVSR